MRLLGGGEMAVLVGACASAGGAVSRGDPGAASPGVSASPVTAYGYHNETSIAINPARPSNVIAVYQVPATAAATEDGGRSWRSQALPGTQAFELAGDPSVLFDGDGRA